MNTNNKKNNEEDVDLTGIINEYSQDSELRKKINEMKKQKEAEKTVASANVNPLTNEEYKSSIYHDAKKIPDISADHDVEKTRVGFEDGQDKTLVIMNGKKSMSVDTESEASYTMYEEEDDIDDAGKTMVTPLSEMKDEMKDVHILDEDDEDDPGDKKMNKAITYGIIGVVTVALLVGIFFGGKYLFDSFLGGDETTTEKTPEKEEPTVENKQPEEEETEEGNDNITDSSAKIAALEKQKVEYENSLATIQDNLKNAKTTKQTAEKTLSDIKKNDWPKVVELQKAAEDYTNEEYELAKSNYKADPSEANKEILDAKEKEYNKAYQQLVSAAAAASTEYYSKYNTAKEAVDSATKNVNTYTTKETDMKNKIADVKNQLADLKTDN